MAFVRFTPRQLEAFVAVASERSFSGAGQRMSLTASAISQLIAELEDCTGFRLFDRTTRNVALTSAGREFLGSAQAALAAFNAADQAASDLRHRAVGKIRVAAPLAIAATILPSAVDAFMEQKPRISLKICDTAVDHLVDAVASSEADIAIGPDRAVDQDVVREPLFESPWVLWRAQRHPLAQQEEVPWSSLGQHALVCAGHDHERGVAQMALDRPVNERVVPVDIVQHITTALGLAAGGRVVTLAPAYVASLAYPLGLGLSRVTEPAVMRQVCLYHSARRALSPASEAFVEYLRAWLSAWIGRQPEPLAYAITPANAR